LTDPSALAHTEAHRLVIAVTGHRNLVESETDLIRERTRELFQDLRKRFPWCRLTLLSPLAEGADLLAAEVAAEESVDLVVPLPKPLQAYLEDFRSSVDRGRFEHLCSMAIEVFEVSGETPPPPADVEPAQWERDYPYARLGVYLSAHSHILLAIWDGESSTHLGGTAQVVRFHQDDVMPGVTPVTVATQQMLVDDESDLVYHIVSSRSDIDHQFTHGHQPGDAFWYSKDPEAPRSTELPVQHEIIFQRAGEFSEDARQFEERIANDIPSLLGDSSGAGDQPGVAPIDRLFRVADWLAIHYQRRTLWTLRVTYLCAFFTGLMFILYTDYEPASPLLIGFLVFFLIAAGVQHVAKRGGWHRRYLDYRTLAEGLRVQAYWAVAGVTPESRWKFAHDTYLRGQNPEFGWIRNVMRVAGLRYDASPREAPGGVEFAIREWIGSDGRGQLGYFRAKARDRLEGHARTQLLGRVSLGVSVLTVLAFTLVGSRLPSDLIGGLTVLMGGSLLLFAVREGYAHATAVKELIKQYEYMLRIYENAYRRMSGASTTHERRKVLLALGQSTLDEHSEWLLMHRERLFEDVRVWRMGG